jgi:CRP-like cAMP-binding protein
MTAAGWIPSTELGRGAAVPLNRSQPCRRNRLLAGLPSADLALLSSHLKETSLETGLVLQEQGERIEDVWFIDEGIVSLLVSTGQGEAIEVATVGHEGAIGLFAGLGPRRSHTGALVQIAGYGCRIPAARFRKAVEDSPAIRKLIVDYGETLLVEVQQSAACNALHDVEARLSRWLLQARDRLHKTTIPLTHEFLSQMLGVSRPTVTVVAHTLQKSGLIRYHRGQIEIVDGPGLEARACECYEIIRRAIDG